MKISLSPRAALLMIAGIFLLPLLLAWLMYSGAIDFEPTSTRNFGQLVEPPIPMSWSPVSMGYRGEFRSAADSFDKHWVILLAVPARCSDHCLQEVSNLRQIHKASGRQRDRIRLALLLDAQSPAELESELLGLYSEFHLVSDPSGVLAKLLGQAATPSSATAIAGNAYLIDPLANIMMVYEAGSDPNHLRKDLKRLLTWSKLDEQQ
jgi:peroxiredoxin